MTYYYTAEERLSFFFKLILTGVVPNPLRTCLRDIYYVFIFFSFTNDLPPINIAFA